jgi:PIN like domain
MAHGFEVLSIKEVFGKGIKDEDWIPQVGKLHGVVITQDKNIHRTKPQRDLLKNTE